MRVPLRLQCAIIAVAMFPCRATAQSSPLGSANADASEIGSQPSAAAINPAAQQPVNTDNGGAIPTPAATLDADRLPSSPSTAVTSSDPGDQRATQDGATGPTSTSATAGIRPHAVTENLTRQQLADRATNRDQNDDHAGLGRNATLMIIGGAGIVVGALVGGAAGTALIVVGAVIGITGLVLILT